MTMSTSTLKFTTEKLSEERVIIWEIKNFTELQEIKSSKNETTILTFTAGQSLKQLSTWELQVKFTKEKQIEFYLYLRRSYKTGKSVYARYWPSVKGTISNRAAGMREYSTTNGGWGWKEFVSLATLEKLKTEGALINDTLTIQVKVVIYGDDMVKDTSPACTQKMLNEKSLNNTSNHFERLLKTGQCSDFVIRVKDLVSNEYVEKKVHRIVLSSQSPVFETMMTSQMSEKEAGVVTIEDLTPKGLEVLLKFIYTGYLHDDWKLVPEEIINATEKYQFPLLKTFCDERLHTLCTLDNAFTFFNLAKQHALSKAYKNISDYIKSNFENVVHTI